jgi:benzoyl-CoA reductase/2-hydroxyglutaryl-CoA dehydratase subunit BcrC/BadD/HgdB
MEGEAVGAEMSASVDSPIVIPHRIETIRAFKAHGGRVAAVLPIHYPRALLRAFDILPVEVWGPPHIDATRGSAHLQPYVCSIVRNALAYLLGGGLDIADLIVVVHTCDSLQGFASILLDFVHPTQPVLPIYLPRGNRESDIAFLVDEFKSLYRRLAEITNCAPSNAELMESNVREETADARLAELYSRRAELALRQIEFYRLVRSREYLPAETFIDLVGAALVAAPNRRPRGSPLQDARIPIIISGIVPEPMAIFDALDKMGAVVVADDFACCGRRLYPAGKSDDPYRRMAERILAAPPDSTRGSAIQERLTHLVRTTRKSGAKGIVFYDVKSCEPELFYLPALRKGLQEAGIPSLTVEVDLNDGLSHQISTRLEAFVEMIV